MFPPKYQGVAVAFLSFCGSISGAIATYLCGLFSDLLDIDDNPQVSGYILCGFVFFSYFGCAPFFFISAQLYKKQLNQAE